MSSPYHPPFNITPRQVTLVGEICECIGRWGGQDGALLSPQLRRANRIQSIQTSLAIENNSLGIDPFTAILEGKRVLGSMREIQEVRHAIVEFMLEVVQQTLSAASPSDQVKALLKVFGQNEAVNAEELRNRLSLQHKPVFRKNDNHPAMRLGLVEMTEPDSPRSPTQRYRLTQAGRCQDLAEIRAKGDGNV